MRKSPRPRNEKDNFHFDSGKLLRTHTSSVQVCIMETRIPPIRIIAPGSAYRRDEIDATHLSVFNQLEGLYIGTDVFLPDLKGTLEYFLHELFDLSPDVSDLRGKITRIHILLTTVGDFFDPNCERQKSSDFS